MIVGNGNLSHAPEAAVSIKEKRYQVFFGSNVEQLSTLVLSLLASGLKEIIVLRGIAISTKSEAYSLLLALIGVASWAIALL